MSDASASPEIVYSVPHEKFFYKADGRWMLSSPVGRAGISAYLTSSGMDSYRAKEMLKTEQYTVVHGVDIIPNAPGLVATAGGSVILNVWTKPTLAAVPGPYPCFQRVLEWLTGDDQEGVEWLKNWMAAKVQDPALVPKTAVVFSGQPGSGKGTIARVLREMLGPENCAVITRRALENRFNIRWINKLFVLADEVVTKDSYVDISEELKALITSDYTEAEGKGDNQSRQRNRLAWVFASNDPVAPVLVEKGDRRYSVFTQHRPLTEEYRSMIAGCFLPNDGLTPDFLKEVQGFYHECLNRTVRPRDVVRPYENESRADLIGASQSGYELFFREVEENGIDSLITGEVEKYLDYAARNEWDYGPGGVSKVVVYQCYVQYCKRTGTKSAKINRFGIAVKHKLPAWGESRNMSPTGKRINCYVVPRTQPLTEPGPLTSK